MADAPKIVRGTLVNGVTVSVSEETADLLGAEFTPEGKTATKKAAAKQSDN